MAPSDLPSVCPHGLRPGTTVCLHCRHDARIAARKRRYLLAVRIGVATMGGAVLVALVVGGIMSVAGNGPSTEADAAPDTMVAVAPPPRPTTVARATNASRTTTTPAVTAATQQAAVVTAPDTTSAVPSPSGAAPSPSIAEGRRELGDSMYAVRAGGEVTVHFDTDSLRTRQDWKFEGVVRATLPLVFGDEVRAALDSVPAGGLVQGGDILNDLPTRGILVRLPANAGIRVWPVTRQGRDGPLVVAYRAAGVP